MKMVLIMCCQILLQVFFGHKFELQYIAIWCLNALLFHIVSDCDMQILTKPFSYNMSIDSFHFFLIVEKEIRLVLFGQAGSGKSALGNMIIGSEVFSRRQTNVLSESYTKQVTKKDTKIYNRRVVVVDTPGIKTSIEFRKHMDEAFHLVQPGPHIFLLVISLDRQFYLQTIRLFEEIMLKYVVIVFTMQSNIDITLEDILNDIQGLRVYFDEFQLRHIIVKSWYRDLNDLNNSRNLEVKRLLQICERHARPEIFFKPATLNS